MWDFEHAPRIAVLAQRYSVHATTPSQCAEDLLAGRAELGLIPVASLTRDMAIVPGCTIASLDRVRSIQLVVKLDRDQAGSKTSAASGSGITAAELSADKTSILSQVRTIAADTASRSSLAYAQILFRKFIGTSPQFRPAPADPIAMLTTADAALLIGDPALVALEDRVRIESTIGPCAWFDLAHEWTTWTGLPWVAAVWAIRPGAGSHIAPRQLIDDLQQSRTNGLAHIDALVEEWTPRIAIPPGTIRHYLTHNIHYELSPDCIAAIELFRRYAVEADILPPLDSLHIL